MKIDSIIFDVDGTIWDASEQVADAYRELLQEKGFHITGEVLRTMMGLTNEEIAERLFPDIDEAARNSLMKQCGEYECEYLSRNGGTLYPDVVEVLHELADHYPLYIVSNCQDGYIETLLDYYDLGHLFQDYECSGKTNLSKGENLKFIVKRNALQHPVYIGDTKRDQVSCEQAMIPFVYASYGFGEADEYYATIHEFSELREMFL